MTKRTKLLSLMVAMVMCFACGIMMMTSSAKAELNIPDAPYQDVAMSYDWSTGKNFDNAGIGVRAAFAKSDWVVFDYEIPAGTTQGAETGSFAFVISGADIPHPFDPSAYPESSAAGSELARAEVAYEANSAFIGNSGTEAKRVRFALSLTDGKIYLSVADGEFTEVGAFANFANVANLAELRVYMAASGKPSNKRFNNVVVYTENEKLKFSVQNAGNFYQAASSFVADQVAAVNLPATAVKPGDGISFTGEDNSYEFLTRKPTTADWIIYEYTLKAGTTATMPQNGLYAAVSNNGHKGAEGSDTDYTTHDGQLFAFASSPSVFTIVEKAFVNSSDVDTPIKLMVNLKTGLLVVERDGAYTTWLVFDHVGDITGTDRYFYLGSNGSKLTGAVQDFIAYDSNGVDLNAGVSGLSKVIVVPDATSEGDGTTISSLTESTMMIRTTDLITSEWVFFEWDNASDPLLISEGAAPGSGGFWIAAGDAEECKTPCATNNGTLITSAMHDGKGTNSFYKMLAEADHVKIAIPMGSVTTPQIWLDGVLTNMTYIYQTDFSNPANDGIAINDGRRHVALWMHNGSATAKVLETGDALKLENFKCYDENGIRLDLTISDTLTYEKAEVKFMKDGAEYAKYSEAMPGSTLKQFADLVVPEGNFVGWVDDQGELFSVNAPIPAEGITLTAKFVENKLSDLSAFAGVYASASKYIELTADGKVISIFSAIKAESFSAFLEGETTYFALGNLNGLKLSETSISINGEVFEKVEDYKTVTLKADGETWKEIKVPTGRKLVSSITYIKLGHKFTGWFVGEEKFVFSTNISNDVELTAKMVPVFAEDTAYNGMAYNYYNKEINALYMLSLDKTYTKIIAGVKTTGTYELLVDGIYTYIAFDADYDNLIRIDEISILDAEGKSHGKLLPEYTITLIAGNGIENVVLTSNQASNYLITMPEDPVLEGFEFKGWVYGNGEAFDGSKVQARSAEIYAVWEYVGGEAEAEGGLGTLSIVAIIVAAAVVVAGTAIFVLSFKGKKA